MVNGESKVTIQLMSSTTAHNMNTSKVKDMEAKKGITSIAPTKNEANSIVKSIETTRVVQINKDTKTTKNLKNTTVSSSEVDKIQDNKVISEKKKLPVFSMLCSKANVDILQHNTNSEHGQNLPKTSNSTEKLSDQKTCGSDNKDVSLPHAEIKKYNLFQYEPPFKVPGLKAGGKIETHAKTSTSSTVALRATFRSNAYYGSHYFTSYSSYMAANAVIPSFHFSSLPYPAPLVPFGTHYQQRPPMTFVPNQNSQFGYFSRRMPPFNPVQVVQPPFWAPYYPMMNFIPYMGPNYMFHPSNPPHLASSARHLTSMGGDGPPYLSPSMNSFSLPNNRAMVNNPYFTSRGNGTKPV
ncbi:uncharacterized protein C1orf94 homolog [Pelobates fuscus]|uniref:uncharacterized protein C1orf94 homolog n=1 Tax=Pelobates fuscus TaxID=191477 RepID=UPI002FE495C9